MLQLRLQVEPERLVQDLQLHRYGERSKLMEQCSKQKAVHSAKLMAFGAVR